MRDLVEQKRQGIGPAVLYASKREYTHQRAPCGAEQARQRDAAAQPPAHQQAPAQHRAGDVHRCVARQQQPIGRGAPVQHLDEGERRGRQVREQARIGEGRGGRVGQKAWVAQDLHPGARQVRRAQGLRVGAGQGFFKTQQDQQQRHGAKAAERHHRGAPAQVPGQQAAQRRAQARNDAQAREGARHGVGPLHRGIQVAHYGARTHHAGAHGSALYGAPEDQRFHGLRQRAAQRGQHIGHQPR